MSGPGLARSLIAGPPTGAQAWAPALPAGDCRNRVMWLNNDRVFYAGLLGQVSLRRMGGWMVYVSLGSPLRLQVAAAPGSACGLGDWVSCEVAVLPPWTAHRVACDQRLVCSLTIEPETVDEAALPGWMLHRQGVTPLDHQAAAALVLAVRQAHAWVCDQGPAVALDTAGFDRLLLGHTLAPRKIDPRIARVLAAICDDPAAAYPAQQGADAAGLSISRFLHLFKAEAGQAFRSLRTWKRARSLLHHVTRDASLVNVALDTGYPDSTHFSHSIRQVYGLKPRELFAGSRRLTVLGDSPAAQAALRAQQGG